MQLEYVMFTRALGTIHVTPDSSDSRKLALKNIDPRSFVQSMKDEGHKIKVTLENGDEFWVSWSVVEYAQEVGQYERVQKRAEAAAAEKEKRAAEKAKRLEAERKAKEESSRPQTRPGAPEGETQEAREESGTRPDETPVESPTKVSRRQKRQKGR